MRRTTLLNRVVDGAKAIARPRRRIFRGSCADRGLSDSAALRVPPMSPHARLFGRRDRTQRGRSAWMRCLEFGRHDAPACDGKPIEIIYVDSASRATEARQAGGQYPQRIISVASARPCAAVARNAGWRRAARGGSSSLVDGGDTVVAADFVRESIADFRRFNHRDRFRQSARERSGWIDLQSRARSRLDQCSGSGGLLRR